MGGGPCPAASITQAGLAGLAAASSHPGPAGWLAASAQPVRPACRSPHALPDDLVSVSAHDALTAGKPGGFFRAASPFSVFHRGEPWRARRVHASRPSARPPCPPPPRG